MTKEPFDIDEMNMPVPAAAALRGCRKIRDDAVTLALATVVVVVELVSVTEPVTESSI
ncbi:hypothetical protein IFT59_07685 [Rhizobium sp. CFBP 8752]|uniref:hypothetical protein n=1 Tax=Rhizobium sp. CFBP 8752 TaxID=2775301 RepID=UPI00177CE777|nr:hypothetical protein [Rhizobium sp. CFBP 8752]MBD8663133.1 hypothetical protein [Rhizobium sp. CFBP 8752]